MESVIICHPIKARFRQQIGCGNTQRHYKIYKHRALPTRLNCLYQLVYVFLTFTCNYYNENDIVVIRGNIDRIEN